LSGIDVSVRNAHGDQNIQLSIIKQLNEQNFDIIVPIGTTACQMTIAQVKNKIIVCAATSMVQSNKNVVTINDEVPITSSIARLNTLKDITVIYSANEKIMPEVEVIKDYARNRGIQLHLATIQTLIDLGPAIKSAPLSTEAFVILKDHLVVSAIPLIMKEANSRAIPLIASDEGSVKSGASFGVGVFERDIGVKSAEVIIRILGGELPNEIGTQSVNQLKLFINKDNFTKQRTISEGELKNINLPIIQL
jgi:putative ABC transport system substrate-binding protein